MKQFYNANEFELVQELQWILMNDENINWLKLILNS